MSKFVKKASKGVAGLGSEAIKKSFGVILGDIIKEILDETGTTAIAKEKMMAAGFKIIKELGVDPKNIQRDLIKNALKSELKLK